MSSISVARWVKLLATVSHCSECLYEGKVDVVYLQVTLCDPHLSAQWSSYTDDIAMLEAAEMQCSPRP